jgi:alpha-beta hydrolase superfamily lysophospholipase
MVQTAPHPVKRHWYAPARLAQRALIYLGIVYLTFCGYLYFEQNSLEYPRVATGVVLSSKEAMRQAKALGLVPYLATPSDVSSLRGYTRVYFFAGAKRGTIVVFHGNGAWAGQRTSYIDAFSPRGFRTFLYEYPGYGGRAGVPSEQTIVPEARALIRSLEARHLGPIYVWGESLGSGVAAAVCEDPTLPVHGLVLLTAWDNVANVGLYRYPFIPVRLLMTDKYDSVANLENFKHPICVVRSTEDEIIPAKLTINLFAHLPNPKKLILQEGYGHDNWPSQPELAWWDDALNFVTGR